ncbi:radical SAM protein [Streptomyces filipinensis]|uniref:radical SAM protein n=1 Tax=Streptomyces filipinensis TaxID=66887 RepID=UPI0036F0EBCA
MLVSTADNCAVNCRFCFRADVGRDVLSLDTYSRALSRLREIGIDELCLSGGEPTDHPEFGRLVRVALQFGFRASVVTAARTGPRLDALAEVAGMLSHVTVSADSQKAEEMGRTGRTIASTPPVFEALGHHRASLHVTAYALDGDDLDVISAVVKTAEVPVEVSPLLPSPTFRFENPDLARDLELISTSFGMSDQLRTVVADYHAWLHGSVVRSCESERLYLSADGFLRRCPYDSSRQVSVFAGRQEIRDALEQSFCEPPTTGLACMAICRSDTHEG